MQEHLAADHICYETHCAVAAMVVTVGYHWMLDRQPY